MGWLAVQINIMESVGYTAKVREFLMNCPHIGLAKLCDRDDACVQNRIEWAYKVLELTGTPICEFIKEQALRVVMWEEMVRLRLCWSADPPSVMHCMVASCGALFPHRNVSYS